jgi:uncharacterized protein YmfQ (DUF2313 family)
MAVSALSVETQAQRLADYLPSGRLFQAGNTSGSNLRKLLTGLAHELFTADGYLADYQNDIAPSVTTYFISEWEAALGIPDACFLGEGTLDERRRDVVMKLASLGVQTAQDFIDTAASFGLTVTVSSAVPYALFPMTFPILLLSEKESRFTIVVTFATAASGTFPLTFPIVFGDSVIIILECLFRRLRPANCDVIFLQV